MWNVVVKQVFTHSEESISKESPRGSLKRSSEGHIACVSSSYSIFRFALLQRAITTAIVRDLGWLFRMKSFVRLFLKCEISKMCAISD